MGELDVRIVELPPLRVASAHAYSASPENDASIKLATWARPKGLLDDPETHRIFGFNNPDPSPGSPNYGYEFCIVVDAETEPEGDIKIKSLPGGLYAVARCKVDGDAETIGATWKKLVAWREESPYQGASHQWLEEHIGVFEESSDTFVLDLYMPIAK
jgi:AraC family transcriptional regulator